jgi:BirA family biotin operon repressor/biotin-[acetyl-CoA-carboxylase] ligase
MIGEPFIILPTIDSTNNYAKGLVKEGLASDGMLIFAEEQTQGRGQKNHVWESQKGENIIMTLIIDANWLKIDAQFELSCATALGCRDFFSKYAGDETCIKWPNDIYWRDRKAGGILIENVIKGNTWETSIIGIGININQVDFGNMNKKPVSLKQITGKPFDTKDLAKELCLHLNQCYMELKAGYFDAQLKAYNQNLYKTKQLVPFKKGEQSFNALVDGVNAKGQLLIKRESTETINHGEIEWML